MNPTVYEPSGPALVLDTNAVLDWLVFENSAMANIVAAIEAGAVRWIVTPGMRGELQRTLSRPALARWRADAAHVLNAFDRWSCLLPEPRRCQHGPLLCSDADDQVFIDLAVCHSAHWLITHDRALHQLARHAARAGVIVVRPSGWSMPG